MLPEQNLAKAQEVMEAMLKMNKIEIKALQHARDQP